jgi:hypothetical protein
MGIGGQHVGEVPVFVQMKASKYSKATMTHQVFSMISWLVCSPNSGNEIFIRGSIVTILKFLGYVNRLIGFKKRKEKRVGLS